MSVIKAIDYYTLVKEMRKKIMEVTGVKNEYVLNAVSVRGPDISKILSDGTAKTSPSLNESFIIFECVLSEGNEGYGVESLDEDTMEGIATYEFKLKIYGNKCNQVALEIISRLRSENQIMDLREKGIFIPDISFPASINEFINNTVYPRCDISITIETRFEVTKVKSDEYTEEYTDISVDNI